MVKQNVISKIDLENKNDCKRDSRGTALVVHSHILDHHFDFSNCKILNTENKYKICAGKEIFQIIKQNNSVRKV